MNAGIAARIRVRRNLVVGPVVGFIATTSIVLTAGPASADTNPINVPCNGTDAANATALAQALTTANSNSQPTTIELGAGCVFHVGINQYGSTGSSAIDWSGSQPLTIDGNGATLEPTGGGEQLLWNDGTLTVDNLTVTGAAGGVVNRTTSGSLTINNSTISNNVGDGGLYNLGTTTITASTIAGNSGLYGAGILNDQNGSLTLNNSTVAGNTATDSAFNYGGAIFTGTVSGFHATTTIRNSTISGNHAVTGSIPGAGNGGIYSVFGTTTIQNSIVAGNTLVGSSSDSDCGGIDNGGGHNLSPDLSCPGAISGDPKLGALAFNGGPTETMALGTGSAAIDVVPASGSGCPATDQRGVARPQGLLCDIGAYEYDTTNPAAPSITTEPANPTSSSSASFVFSDADPTGNLFCQLDTSPFMSCTSPKSYAGPLTDGSHAFTVKAVDALTNNSSTATYDWTIDTVAPTVSLNAVTSPTTIKTPTFSGTAGLASGDSSTVTVDVYSGASPNYATDNPVQPLTTTADPSSGAYSVSTTSGLADGVYTARASQSDTAGNTGTSTPTTFTVDTDKPGAPSISSSPSLDTRSTSASFTFSASDPDGIASYQCEIDGATFSTCTSPTAYPGPLTNGLHSFQVEVSDNAGNTSSAASYTWTVDTVAPAVALDPPSSPTNSTTPSFAGTGGLAAGDSATVTVDVYSGITPNYATDTPLESLSAAVDPSSGAFSVAASPSLADGDYTARASQSDGAGNTGHSTPRVFTVDTGQPAAPTFENTPALTTNQKSADFLFQSSDPDGVGSYSCQLDGGGFSACSFPGEQRYSQLSDGPHTFEVEAEDLAGNTGLPASYTWTVDTVAPTVSLNTVTSLSNNAAPTFSGTGGLASGDSGSVTVDVYPGFYPDVNSTVPVQTLVATLDPSTGAYSVSTSPSLADGVYTARVIQTDSAGNTGAGTPSAFTVDTDQPAAPSFTTEPASFTKATSASFAWDASDGDGIASFQCNLDGAGFSSCSEGQQFTGLTAGGHTMAVEATDYAGNTSPSSTSYAWTIVTSTDVAITSITDPLNSANDTSAAASGTATPGDSVALTVSDGNPSDNVTSTVTSTTAGTWSIGGLDLSGLAGGAITWTAVATDAATNTATATRTGSKAYFVGCGGSDAANESALAGAFDAANANPPSNVIELGANCIFNISSAHWSPDTAFGSYWTLTIDGNGSTLARSSAPGTPDFDLLDNVGNMTINGLTVTNGSVAIPGGGIDNSGPSLTINDSTISNNVASGNEGGGIYSSGSTLTITNSTISGNSGGSVGGGILVGNGSLVLTNSTVSGNSAGSFDGGGIMVNPNSTATVTNSTITGNTVQYFGAGIYNFASTVHLADSTVAGNTTTGGGSGAGFYNGGTADVQNSILANNTDTTSGPRNCSGSVTDLGHNISFPASDGSCPAGFSQGDPKLGPLASNGGPTQTMALFGGSAAIDQIPPVGSGCLPTDQRGTPRPQGNGCDIGAFESTGFTSTTTAITSISPASGKAGQPYTVAGTVTPSAASGSVTVSDGTEACNATLIAGGFSCALTNTIYGPETITATYQGDAHYNTSSTTAPYAVGVITALTYTGATTASVGGTVRLSATLTANGAALPGQVVNFSVGLTSVNATTSASGVASVSTTAPATAGTYPVSVSYAGNPTDSPATASGSLLVSGQSTATKVAYTGATSAAAGASLTLSATLTTSKGKTVAGRTISFGLNGATYTAVTNSSGIATSTASAPATGGSYTITVNFGGDVTYGPSATTAALAVKSATTVAYTGAQTAVHGSTILLGATLSASGAPFAGKTVTFTFNGKKYSAVTNASGVASISVPTPRRAGAYPVVVAFAGDANDAASSVTVNLTIT